MCIRGILYFCQSYKPSERVISLLYGEWFDVKKNWPGGIYACERFSVLALVICCVAGRLWTFMKRRMLWTLWQKTEYITLSQSHQKMPGIRGSFVRFVHSVQVWPNYSWENLGNIINSLLLEKRGDLFQSVILCLLGGTTPTLGTPCCSYWDGGSSYQPVTGLPLSYVAVSMLNSRVTSGDTQNLNINCNI